MGKAITSHFSRIMLANQMDDASSSSDSDDYEAVINPSLQFKGLKVGSSTDSNSDSSPSRKSSDDSCNNAFNPDYMFINNSTADNSPCKKLSRRKAVTLNIPALSRPAPTKECLEARRVSTECLSVATSNYLPKDVTDSIHERELSLLDQTSN